MIGVTSPAYMARAVARGDDPPKPTVPVPDDLREWREAEGLTQAYAAALAGVQRVAWARWEGGARSVPQWLRDTLMQRWGSAP